MEPGNVHLRVSSELADAIVSGFYQLWKVLGFRG